jgi:hypothetical protein
VKLLRIACLGPPDYESSEFEHFIFSVVLRLFTAPRMKMTRFWYVAPCSLIELTNVSKVFTVVIIREIIALTLYGASTSET